MVVVTAHDKRLKLTFWQRGFSDEKKNEGFSGRTGCMSALALLDVARMCASVACDCSAPACYPHFLRNSRLPEFAFPLNMLDWISARRLAPRSSLLHHPPIMATLQCAKPDQPTSKSNVPKCFTVFPTCPKCAKNNNNCLPHIEP